MKPEQQFKDAAREWLERDGAAPAWVEHHLLSLAALLREEVGKERERCAELVLLDGRDYEISDGYLGTDIGATLRGIAAAIRKEAPDDD